MILGYEANIGLIYYGPKWSWAEMVMGRNGHGPKWLWAEMTRNHPYWPPVKIINRLFGLEKARISPRLPRFKQGGNVTCSRPQQTATRPGLEPGTP